MKHTVKRIALILVALLAVSLFVLPAFAEEAPDAQPAQTLTGAAAQEAPAAAETGDNSSSVKAICATAAIALVAGIGAFAMAWSITKAADGISRQPEAANNIRTMLMLGLVFIETAIIYALIVAILIIFVL